MNPAFPILLAAALAAPTASAGDEFPARLDRARKLAAAALKGSDAVAVRDAHEAFVVAARLEPGNPIPWTEAGLFALATGDGPGAARSLEAAGKAGPDSAPFRFLRGSMLLARGEFQDALPDFRAAAEAGFRAKEAEDRAFECLLGRGFRLLVEHDLAAAAGALAEAAAARPRHPLVARSLRETARAHRQLKRPKDAERVLRDCVARFPTYAPARADLGDLLADLARIDEALPVLAEAVRVDPDCAEAHLARADAFASAARFAEADASFAAFARLSPPTGESEWRRGRYFRAKGAPREALDAFRRSLALEPERLPALYGISLCLRDLGLEAEAEAALDAFRKAEAARRAKSHGAIPADK